MKRPPGGWGAPGGPQGDREPVGRAGSANRGLVQADTPAFACWRALKVLELWARVSGGEGGGRRAGGGSGGAGGRRRERGRGPTRRARVPLWAGLQRPRMPVTLPFAISVSSTLQADQNESCNRSRE